MSVTRPAFTTLFTLGAGDVVRSRVRVAIHELATVLGIKRVAYLDLSEQPFPEPPLDPTWERFVLLTPGESALNVARREGLLGEESLALVCTPTAWHVPYAREFAPHVGRVGVEKPLCHDPKRAASLADHEGRVHPLGHQLFKSAMRDFTTACSRGELAIADVSRVQFTLFEAKGVGTRQIDDAVWDLGWHGLECALAPILALTGEAAVEVDAVQVATYHGGPDEPRATTAALIEGHLTTGTQSIPLTVRVGKGLGADRKVLEVFGPDGGIERAVSLAEGGHHAHRRMIEELWLQDEPEMQLGLSEVVRVVEACADAVERAEEMPSYRFGELPGWLAPETPARVRADAA